MWGETDSLVDGGGATDTLKVLGVSLDLTTTGDGLILGVEQVDLTDGSANMLTVAAADVLAMSPVTKTLKIIGEAGDTVDIFEALPITPPPVVSGYRTYTIGTAKLVVDADITVA